MRRLKPWALGLLVLGVYLLHQDFWHWRTADPLVFGFLPIGLAYHAGYSVLAACLMSVLVWLAWPKHLESAEANEPQAQRREKREEGEE
jgi:hypothetical protein